MHRERKKGGLLAARAWLSLHGTPHRLRCPAFITDIGTEPARAVSQTAAPAMLGLVFAVIVAVALRRRPDCGSVSQPGASAVT